MLDLVYIGRSDVRLMYQARNATLAKLDASNLPVNKALYGWLTGTVDDTEFPAALGALLQDLYSKGLNPKAKLFCLNVSKQNKAPEVVWRDLWKICLEARATVPSGELSISFAEMAYIPRRSRWETDLSTYFGNVVTRLFNRHVCGMIGLSFEKFSTIAIPTREANRDRVQVKGTDRWVDRKSFRHDKVHLSEGNLWLMDLEGRSIATGSVTLPEEDFFIDSSGGLVNLNQLLHPLNKSVDDIILSALESKRKGGENWWKDPPPVNTSYFHNLRVDPPPSADRRQIQGGQRISFLLKQTRLGVADHTQFY